MERTRLYNTSTGKCEYFTIHYVRMPWQGLGARLRAFLRYANRHNPVFPYETYEPAYELDTDTLRMRDPKRERRQMRRDRRDRLLAKAADALNSMVDMQKFIK